MMNCNEPIRNSERHCFIQLNSYNEAGIPVFGTLGQA